MTLRIGLYVPTWPGADRVVPRWADMRSLALDAESAGADTLWVADEPGFWECWTVLTAVTAATSRVEVGPLIANTRYRSPSIFATMVRALDEVSGGRLVLGLGSGNGPSDRRWPAYGFATERHVARFGEAVEIIARLLRDPGPVTFEGEFHRVEGPDLGPVGPRPAGPPIWIAAGRPRTTEVAARWGDAVNAHSSLPTVDAVKAFRARVRAACEAVGRDPATLRLTGWTRLAPSPDGRLDAEREDTISGTPSAIAERLEALGAAGLEHVTCFIGDPADDHRYPALTPAALARFEAVLAALRG